MCISAAGMRWEHDARDHAAEKAYGSGAMIYHRLSPSRNGVVDLTSPVSRRTGQEGRWERHSSSAQFVHTREGDGRGMSR